MPLAQRAARFVVNDNRYLEVFTMPHLLRALLAISTLLLITHCESPSPPLERWPGEEWETCTPSDAGVDEDALDRAVAQAMSEAAASEALLIIRHGCIVSERYGASTTAETRVASDSVAKSFTSAAVGMALARGSIESLDQPLCEGFEAWDCDDETDIRREVTLRHALTLTTGLEWQEDWETFEIDDVLAMYGSDDHVAYVLSKPSAHPPGTHFSYSTGDPALLSVLLEESTGNASAADFAHRELFRAIGAPGIEWASDPSGNTMSYAELSATAREYARFGYLYLREGRWREQRLIPREWVEQSTHPDPEVEGWDGYGYLWHINLASRAGLPSDSVPEGTFLAGGYRGQSLIVIPALDMVVVRLPNTSSVEPVGEWDELEFLSLLSAAIAD